MRIKWWLWIGLAGCTPQAMPQHMASEPARIAAYKARSMEPGNCGTPDEFKFCISTPPPLIAVTRETLPDLTPQDDQDDADTVLHRLRNTLSPEYLER